MSSDSQKINTECYRANGVYFFSAMLPSVTNPDKLFSFAPALYAKLEQVAKQRQQHIDNSDLQASQLAKLKSEELMLQQVVEWVKNCDRSDRK